MSETTVFLCLKISKILKKFEKVWKYQSKTCHFWAKYKYINSKNAFKTVLGSSEAEKNSFLVLTDVVYMTDVVYSFNRDRQILKFLIIFDIFDKYQKFRKYRQGFQSFFLLRFSLRFSVSFRENYRNQNACLFLGQFWTPKFR